MAHGAVPRRTSSVPTPAGTPWEAKGGALSDAYDATMTPRRGALLPGRGGLRPAAKGDCIVTQNKDFKRLVRARMAETGESYTTARSQILRHHQSSHARGSASVTASPLFAGPGSPRINIRRRMDRLAGHRIQRFPWLSVAFSSPAILFFIVAMLPGCSPAGGDEQRVIIPSAAVHVVGTSEVIARVVDLQPADDGRVWLLNSIEPFFVVLNSDGRVERAFGRSGGGPEEFGAPLALVHDTESGGVWTYDLLRHALIEITSGQLHSLRLSQDSLAPTQLVSFAGAGAFPARPWLAVGRGGFLLGRVRAGSAPPFSGLGLWNADIVLVRRDSTAPAVEIHTPVADLLGRPASRYPRATRILPYPLWTICVDGTLGLYDPLENELRRVAANGRVLATVALPQERQVELTFDRLFGIAYRQLHDEAAGPLPDSLDLRRQFTEMFSEWEPQLASVFPEYADLQCARDGTLWLQLFDVAVGILGRGRDWYQISEQGSRTLVTLPEKFRPYRFGPDRIWGTVRDSLGVAFVAWIGSDALGDAR
jgi:hypothetical protein